MNCQKVIVFSLLFPLLSICAAPDPTAAQAPNIIVILADDMGYGDMGCVGSKTLKTPSLDRLAASGVICSRAYVASAVCSPSRAGLLTGRDPRRFGYEGNLNQTSEFYSTRPDYLGLPTNEHTLADHLKAAGYRTAHIGKWHLGSGAAFHPNRRGFDYFCGFLGGDSHYFPAVETTRLERNGHKISEFSSPYLTDFFTDEAMRWIQGGDRTPPDSQQPFFLYLAYNAPHTPMEATPEDLKLFAHIADNQRRTYAAMVYALDRGVGRVLDWIEKDKKATNTLVVFLSDNGATSGNGSWNGVLSGSKGTLLEGGIRVPMIWSWPGRIPTGGHCDSPISSLDLLPTFMAAAGAKPLPLAPTLSYEDKVNRKRASERYGDYDGINVLPGFTAAAPSPERTLFWRLQGQRAVLHGEDKLIVLSHRPPQLFQPKGDPAETRDLAALKPEKVRELFKQLGEWESILETAPLFDESPRWWGESAKAYDTWGSRPEPQ